MNYAEALPYLYERLPMFQRQGKAAIKTGLGNIITLCERFGNPHLAYPTIHVAGTNGKGSTCHSLAAVLQSAGYRTGLYTSPHLKDFTERKRINGHPAPQAWVADFVTRNKALIEELDCSFFELSVLMAFLYFAEEKVDIAVIEVGLGGRLDSTNIVQPQLSVITSISFDHLDVLGDTLPLIAAEKGGIIKPHTPVVISQWHEETAPVFSRLAAEKHAPITFADQKLRLEPVASTGWLDYYHVYEGTHLRYSRLPFSLTGSYQRGNLPGILAAVDQLRKIGYQISDEHVATGLGQVQQLTGLKGRWQVLSQSPLVICDIAHNEGGLREAMAQLARISAGRQLHFVIGVMRDKDLGKMLPLLPRSARYYCCAPDTPRALPPAELAQALSDAGLSATVIGSVPDAVAYLYRIIGVHDVGYIGGSTFVVAEIPNL